MIELVATRDRENFIVNIQAAFKQAVVEEFGDDGKEVIPREDVEKSFAEDGAKIFDILSDGKIVGGVVVVIRPSRRNELALLFVNVDCHSRGVGSAAWRAIEKLFPDTEVWETMTPYFDKRNLHFYINKCGFHAVEFYNPHHRDPNEEDDDRFEKFMDKREQTRSER